MVPFLPSGLHNPNFISRDSIEYAHVCHAQLKIGIFGRPAKTETMQRLDRRVVFTETRKQCLAEPRPIPRVEFLELPEGVRREDDRTTHLEERVVSIEVSINQHPRGSTVGATPHVPALHSSRQVRSKFSRARETSPLESFGGKARLGEFAKSGFNEAPKVLFRIRCGGSTWPRDFLT